MISLIKKIEPLKHVVILTFLGVCLSSINAFSQYKDFKTYTLESGLPQSNVYAIYNDSRGYLWIGTEVGLCRFDGIEFKNFSKKNGLIGNLVRCITEDQFGNIWAGTDEGISIYDGKTFENLDSTSGISPNPVYSFFKDSKNNIWVSIPGGGAYKISFSGNKKYSITNYNKQKGLSSDKVFAICEDGSGRIIIGTFGSGINIIANNKIDILQKPLIPSNAILSITKCKNGDIWFGSFENGVFAFQNGFKTKNILKYLQIIPLDLTENPIWNIFQDSKEDIWLATEKSGVYRFSKNTTFNFNEKTGLPGNQVYKVYQDKEGNIWMAFMGNGLCKFNGDKFSHFDSDDGIDNRIYGIAQDNKKNLWFASNGSGLIKFKVENGLPKTIVLSGASKVSDLFLNSLVFDHENILWLASAHNGIYRFDGQKILNFNAENGLINNEVNRLFIDSKNNLWIGTIGGISIFKNNSFFNIDDKTYGLPNNEIQSFAEDQSGNVWVGTLAGLAKFNFEKRQMTTFDKAEGLIEKKISCLTSDSKNNIWIGTSGGGLYFYNHTHDKFPISLFADDKILSSDNINSLVYSFNFLYVGTDKGFDRIKINETNNKIESILHYDKTNGFSGVENNPNSIFVDEDKNVWFGTVKGVTRYSGSNDYKDSTVPVLHITAIKLFFKDIDWGKRTNNLTKWFNYPKSLVLNHNENHLTIQFEGISLRNPERVYYKYKLDGLEEEWSPARKDREVIYSGLKHGKYVFELIAKGENDIWSKPLKFTIEIKPPFWATWWFIVLIVLASCGIIFSYISYRESKLKRDKVRLEKIVKERTAEILEQKEHIEQQNLVLEEQKKEIHDSINYASRIQMAILPNESCLCKYFNGHFILFRPRDIVSGDFYWFAEKNDTLIIALADCTGHGVPGAFMSMLGISFLNEIVIEKNILKPSEILNALRKSIIKALQHDGSSELPKDGMDIVVISYSKNDNKLLYAAANSTFYQVTNNELIEHKPDKMPVAVYSKMDSFNEFEIAFNPGDEFYLCSDGFQDQFGGPIGKKFLSKKLRELLLSIHTLEMTVQKKILDETLIKWMLESNQSQIDDVSIFGFKI